MPIVYNRSEDKWQDSDLTNEEKESLIKIAIEVITDQAGEMVGNQLLRLLKEHSNQNSFSAIQVPEGGFKAQA